MSIVDAQANSFLDLLLGTVGILPNPLYVGLMTAAPNFDGTGVVEPAGASGYSRPSVANTVGEWPAAVGREKVHTSDIVFPMASASWGTITHAGLFQSVLGNDLVVFAPLDYPRVINATDVFRFIAATSPYKVRIPAT
jgi:hypothetical protein